MNQIVLDGRTDVDEFFARSGIFDSEKLSQTPFLAFVSDGDVTRVRVIDTIASLLHLPDVTPVMCQWRGEWRSDYFQFTVGQVRHFAEKHSAPLKSARNVVKYVGPQGGFRSLSYEYVDEHGVNRHLGTQFKGEAERLEAFFRQNGIPVEVRRP